MPDPVRHTPPPHDPRRGGGRPWLWLAAAGLLLALLVGWLLQRFPGALANDDDRMRFFYLLALLVAVSAGIAGGWRYRAGVVFRQAAAWLAVALVLIVGYSFRFELQALYERVAGEVLPHRAVATGPDSVTVRRGANRHFNVEARVDGVPIRFLVDTGATEVVLSPDDARRLGFDLSRLSFDRYAYTANGRVASAPVRLGEIRIGPISVGDVRASVNGAHLDRSLLGLSFLDRLGAYEVREDTLTLRQ